MWGARELVNRQLLMDHTSFFHVGSMVFGLKDEPQVLSDWETKAALFNLSAHHESKSFVQPLAGVFPIPFFVL